MNILTRQYGFIYEVDIQSLGVYYCDYLDVQIIPMAGGNQMWVYYHNKHGSTYAK